MTLHDWAALRVAGGLADKIPHALERLFRAKTPDEAESAYWGLENCVVVQGQLFEAAEDVVPVLLAALLEPSPSLVRISILELLFQIVSGDSHSEEPDVALGEKCRLRAREGLWVLYGELKSTHFGWREAAAEIIEVIAPDSRRLPSFLQELGAKSSPHRA